MSLSQKREAATAALFVQTESRWGASHRDGLRKQDGGLLSVKFEELGRIKVIRGAAVS
jgi:hypothetical protein